MTNEVHRRKSVNKGKETVAEAKKQSSHLSLWNIITLPSFLSYLIFFFCFFCWVVDAFDFYSVSLTLAEIATDFQLSIHEISQAVTVTLLFRPVGAIIFGLLGDKYGRKWALVVNMLIISLFELATAFVHDYSTFLIVRAGFGVAMGGIWGLASATAMDSMPLETRGFFSGVFHPGYSIGIILCIGTRIGNDRMNGDWRLLFLIGAFLSAFAALGRAFLPESARPLKTISSLPCSDSDNESTSSSDSSISVEMPSLMTNLHLMLKRHWGLCLWAVCLTTGLSGLSNGSLGIYPSFLSKTKLFSRDNQALILLVANIGGVLGPLVSGAVSQRIGRSATIFYCTLLTLAAVPLSIIPSHPLVIMVGYSFLQIGFQGAWGIIPVYLYELAPLGFKSFFPGLTNQLGVMASCGYTYLIAIYGDSHLTAGMIPDYGTGLAVVLVWSVALVLFLLTIGKRFETIKLARFLKCGSDEIELCSNKV